MLEKEFVPYIESLALKQLGFNEPCFGRFDGRGKNKGKIWYEMPNTGQDSIPVGDVLAPTYSQAFRWFREKHQIVCVIDFYNDGDLWEDTMYTVTISEFEHFKSHDSFVQFEYKTYEEVELACLRKLIEIVKNKQLKYEIRK